MRWRGCAGGGAVALAGVRVRWRVCGCAGGACGGCGGDFFQLLASAGIPHSDMLNSNELDDVSTTNEDSTESD